MVNEIPKEKIDIGIEPSKEIEISSIIFTFDELRKELYPPIDFLKLREFQDRIGKLGEVYAYELECEKLLGTIYEGRVDNTKALDPSNGYDILSYDKLNGSELYIEVKTTIYNESDFFISSGELNVAKKMISQGKRYLIYRVTNILAENKEDINLEIIKDISDKSKFELIETNYRVKKKLRT